MLKHARYLGLILASFFIFSGCSSLKVHSDYDKSIDFSQFKTYSYYGWQKESDKLLNRFDKERLEKSFAAEFDKRGIKYVESGGDMVVSLFIVLDQKTSTTAYTDHYGAGGYGYGYGYGYSPWGWGMGSSTTTYQDYDYIVGTLVVDAFNSANKQLIWQGVGSDTVNENPEKREKNIPIVAERIMSEYPVKPLK